MNKEVKDILIPKEKPTDCTGLIKCIKEWKSFILAEEDCNNVGDLSWGINTSQGVFEYWQPQLLYIVDASAPINEGDCVYITGTKQAGKYVAKQLIPNGSLNGLIKIVATTDPKLIADGVLSISDEFLKEYVRLYGKGKIMIEIQHDYKGSRIIGSTPAGEAIKMGKYQEVPKLDPSGNAVLSIVPREKFIAKLDPIPDWRTSSQIAAQRTEIDPIEEAYQKLIDKYSIGEDVDIQSLNKFFIEGWKEAEKHYTQKALDSVEKTIDICEKQWKANHAKWTDEDNWKEKWLEQYKQSKKTI